MPLQWFTVCALADAKAVQVYIHGIIGEWGLSDRELIRDVEAAGDDVELIEVTINSPGGEVDHGLVIYNSSKAYPATVFVHIDSIAACVGTNGRSPQETPSSYDVDDHVQQLVAISSNAFSTRFTTAP